MRLSLADIARLVDGELIGDGNVEISGCSGIMEAKAGEITFLGHPKYLPQAEATRASAMIIPRQMSMPGKSVIRADNPSLAFTQVLNRFIEHLPDCHPKGIASTAVIAPDVHLGKSVAVGAYTIIESGVVIGDGSVIYGHCYIGHGARIGARSLVYPQVVVREEVSIGSRVIIHSGTVIGCDGYGYATLDGKHVKIPQMGTVIVEDDVEIGANVTIDRARFDKTVIGEGTKIDNLVQIAHNVIIGKHCLIVAQVGISGSARVGNHAILAGQVGVAGHLTIGDGAVVAAQSGVSKTIKAGEHVFGSPAKPIKEAFRANAYIGRLEHYAAAIKDLKKRIEELEKRI